jgi:pSer/pThr/pTyr-binding forkhead associated (FHA) protein
MTDLPSDSPAWLEGSDGDRRPIRGACSIGRSASNQVALTSDKVSRRHALIQVQREKEFWLVDFGSRNGTYLNGQRIVQPSRLQPQDRIKIGPFEFVFHLPQAEQLSSPGTVIGDKTVSDIRQKKCWLLVADLIDSTRLAKELPLEELPMVTGRWVAECKQTIEEHGGRINQFLGDGFFAYWHDREKAEVVVGNALHALRRMQEQARPPFRVVTHLGEVAIGGISVGEEERISGEQVHFTFRMEKLAGRLAEPRILSKAAWERLAAVVEAREVGNHAMPGFESKVAMYAF